MFSKKSQIILSIGILAILFLASGLYFLRDFQDKKLSRTLEEAKELAQKDNITNKPKIETSKLNIEKSIVVTANLSEVVRKGAIEEIERLREEIKKNGEIFEDLMALALQTKLIGDLKGAEEIWVYITEKWLDQPTPYINLANLYIYDYKDFKKGETYLLRAISKAPFLVDFYYSAYEFYRFVMKDIVKARSILEQGIASQPFNVEVLEKVLSEF